MSSNQEESSVSSSEAVTIESDCDEGGDGVSSSTSITSESRERGEGVKKEGSPDEISSSGDVLNDAKLDVFAQPMLPPPGAMKAPASSSKHSSAASSSTGSSSSSHGKGKERLSKEKLQKYNQILSSLNYQTPKYAASSADNRYNLEVLKNGAIVDSVKFSSEDNKGYYIVGRVPGCDVLAENPTVSRLHAILQFVKCPEKDKSEANEASESGDSTESPEQSGLYLFDLKSTHGTFINKNQVFPQKFYRVHVGHVLKFGSSQRMYIVNGPSEDEEEESDKSVTELMNEKLQKDLERKRLEEEEQMKRAPNSKLPRADIEQVGIDWGMGEDADEETDMRVNPFAMDYESSELTLDNPKKSLRSWFEREGEDLEYEIREKGSGQYVCRIALPLDGPTDAPVYAESEVKGKKKEAAHDAALKACQILDSHGLLRTSNQESRKRKERRYEDEDYYSSDEDTFLDRTGSVEKKREKRLRLAGKVGEKVETYDSLCIKHSELESEVTDLQAKIKKAQEMKSRADDGEMDVDDYMNMLKTGVFDVKKLRTRLKEVNEDLKNTKQMIDITKPADLPAYLQKKAEDTSTATSQEKVSNEEPATAKLSTSEASGDDGQELESTSTSSTNQVTDSSNSSVQKDESSELVPPPRKRPVVGPLKPPTATATATGSKPKLYGLILPSDLKPGLSLPEAIRQQKIEALEEELEKDEDLQSSDDEGEGNSRNNEDDLEEEADEGPEFVAPNKPKRKRQRYKNKHKPKDASVDFDDPKYSTWVPPKNQSGDGRTSLNEKLGY